MDAGGYRSGASSMKENLAVAFPGRLEMNRRQAALQQINVAIELFHRRDWACAITLALAAETQLPNGEKPFVSSVLKDQYGAEFMDEVNEPRNWLKHSKEPEIATIFEMDAVMAILRVISKFTSLYGAWSDEMAGFDAWMKQARTNTPDSN
jgi:hypothetical protein